MCVPQSRILVVDDEPDICDLVSFNLERAGYEVITAADGLEAVHQAKAESPDLVILDIMLPQMDGYTAFQRLRADSRTREIPVLMLTARAQLSDKIKGLELGADDYLTKPFSPKELVLRAGALLKRSVRAPAVSVVDCGPFRLDKNNIHFFLDGEQVELTPIEFKLLVLLIERRGHAQERADLLREVWGYSDLSYSRTLDTHMRRLREKLGKHGNWIQTVRGVGYCFVKPGDERGDSD